MDKKLSLDLQNNIANIDKEAKINSWPFPKKFEALKAASLESYEVHFADYYKAQFNGTYTHFIKETLDGYSPIKASSNFNAEGIKNAIIRHIKEKTPYIDFLQDIAANGSTHYKVDMKERTVTYFNADESSCYREKVPQYEFAT